MLTVVPALAPSLWCFVMVISVRCMEGSGFCIVGRWGLQGRKMRAGIEGQVGFTE